MLRNITLICFCILLYPSFPYCQTRRIDSLKALFNKASTDDEKLDALFGLSHQYASLNIDTLNHYSSMARQMALSTHDDKKIALADVFVEECLIRRAFYDSALHLCNRDLQKVKYTVAYDEYAQVAMQKSFVLAKNNKYKEALNFTYSFLREADSHDDTLSQIYCKYILGSVYRNMQQADLAMRWFFDAANTGTNPALVEWKNACGIYFLTGMMYNWQVSADTLQSDITRDSIREMYYIDHAIEYSRKYENLAILARSLCIKADGTEDLHKTTAGVYLKEATRIYDELHDTTSIINGITATVNYYIAVREPDKGIDACKKGLAIINRGNAFPLPDIYWALAECYKIKGDYLNYAETMKTIVYLRDTVYKRNSEQDLAEMNAKYEDQKKETTIIQQKLDIAAKKNTIYVSLILVAVLSGGILILFRYYQRRQKVQAQKAAIAVAEAEEAERKRISADLHDNIGAYAAVAASSISELNGSSQVDAQTLVHLKDAVQNITAQLNDTIWVLNKKALPLTAIADRFKLFVQKLEPFYPEVETMIDEQVDTDFELSPVQALHLFRIMQEAFNNALKHSGCTSVVIHFVTNKAGWQVNISDNGKGMKIVNGHDSKNGNGLVNMRLRAKQSGWRVDWEHYGERGTRVIISSAGDVPTTN